MSIKRDKIIKTSSSGRRYIVQPEHVKIQAVKELESGLLTLKEAMKKYEVKKGSTIRRWLKQYSSTPEKYEPREEVSIALKRQTVREIELGILTRKKASEKVNVSVSTISYWIKKYSYDFSGEKQPEKVMKLENSSTKEIEKELQQAKLRIAGLETMIDLAEEEFKIEIRKKSGTKQSN